MSLPYEVTDKKFILQIKRLREQILIGNKGNSIKSVILTSMNKRHGTSTVTANLAYAMSRYDNKKILLIDGNNAYPDCSPDLSKVLKKPLIDNLYVLKAPWNNGSDKGWAEARKSLKSLQEEFSYILFDMPPVSRVPEVMGLVPLVDLVLVVLRAKKVKWQAFNKVKESFMEANPRNIGVVLNRKKYYIPSLFYRWL